MSLPHWARCGVLVLGARGMLGHELVDALNRRLGKAGTERVTAWGRDELDISDRPAVLATVRDLMPSVVFNAAAYANVDACETNSEEAMAVNALAPGYIAEACARVNALMVHFGTDFIFDGLSRRPYRPKDAANPLSVYGRSKWEGEQAVRATGCHHLIVRTSWLFGPHGRNFVEAILTRARAGKPLSVVTDQAGSPTLASDLAEAVVRLLDARARGTFHFANSGHCSRFEFAEAIVRLAGLDTPVRPISSADLVRSAGASPGCDPTKGGGGRAAGATRPAYSVLDTTAYVQATGRHPATWQDALRRYLATWGKAYGRDSRKNM